jgi:hypothetical protein
VNVKAAAYWFVRGAVSSAVGNAVSWSVRDALGSAADWVARDVVDSVLQEEVLS